MAMGGLNFSLMACAQVRERGRGGRRAAGRGSSGPAGLEEHHHGSLWVLVPGGALGPGTALPNHAVLRDEPMQLCHVTAGVCRRAVQSTTAPSTAAANVHPTPIASAPLPLLGARSLAHAQMVRVHDRDSSGTITFPEFRSLHMQLGEIRAAFSGAARGADTISPEQVQQLVAAQGEAQGQPEAAGLPCPPAACCTAPCACRASCPAFPPCCLCTAC